ncbi:ElaA protein [Chitinophaga costaii]|uniref:ElaA protein n=1 Tax=Chitinophaga costaii TaxID=1335309 RepID=A0A1C4DN57_9BACT|nr:GNAT family N-acetyltransferase [Chitinophaga costaii]PUZ27706.1 GNAT family N-acetyltransferase [Chitinophaga costaii]SCC32721.1 ElaA protein [Chitinophaga costaii]
MNWTVKSFDELTAAALYHILHLRAAVFVVEQHCPYQDMDYADQQALHLMGTLEGDLVAYTRLFAPHVKYPDKASIGRVVTASSVRGTGAGRKLMEASIRVVEERFGKVPIKIGAQQYLTKFYQSLGFVQSSEMYLEDGIPHIEMVRE